VPRRSVYGESAGSTPFRDVFAFSLDSSEWNDITPTNGQLPPIRGFHSANHIDGANLMLVYGGFVDLTNIFTQQFYEDVWISVLQ
jgi:hypothetical protein